MEDVLKRNGSVRQTAYYYSTRIQFWGEGERLVCEGEHWLGEGGHIKWILTSGPPQADLLDETSFVPPEVKWEHWAGWGGNTSCGSSQVELNWNKGLIAPLALPVCWVLSLHHFPLLRWMININQKTSKILEITLWHFTRKYLMPHQSDVQNH